MRHREFPRLALTPKTVRVILPSGEEAAARVEARGELLELRSEAWLMPLLRSTAHDGRLLGEELVRVADEIEASGELLYAGVATVVLLVVLLVVALLVLSGAGCALPLPQRQERSRLVWVRTKTARGPMVGTGSVIGPGETLVVGGRRARTGDVVTVQHVAPGDRVTIITHHGPVPAHVVWRQRGWVGLRADKPGDGTLHGDSGSPVESDSGEVVGLVEGGQFRTNPGCKD